MGILRMKIQSKAKTVLFELDSKEVELEGSADSNFCQIYTYDGVRPN